MGEAIISRRGGSAKIISNGYAYIVVTYPKNDGSTCHCEKGNTKYQSKSSNNAVGSVIFAVPSSGDWSVYITKENQANVPRTVSITQKGQVVKLDLRYKLFLIENGILQGNDWTEAHINNATSVQNGSSSRTYTEITFGYGGSGWHGSGYAKIVDLTNYKKLVVVGRRTTQGNNTANTVGIMNPSGGASATSESPGTALIVQEDNRIQLSTSASMQTYELTVVEEKTGDWWVGVWGYSKSDEVGGVIQTVPETIRIQDMWLE